MCIIGGDMDLLARGFPIERRPLKAAHWRRLGLFTADEEADFVAKHLGLEARSGQGDRARGGQLPCRDTSRLGVVHGMKARASNVA